MTAPAVIFYLQDAAPRYGTRSDHARIAALSEFDWRSAHLNSNAQ